MLLVNSTAPLDEFDRGLLVAGVVEHQPDNIRGRRRGRPICESDDVGLLAAIREGLVDRVAKIAARVETAELACKILPAQDQRGLVTGPIFAHPTKAAIEVATPVMV